MNNQNGISENSFARWAIYQGWDPGASKNLRGSPLTESQMQFVLDTIRSGGTENSVSTLDDSTKKVSAYLYSLGTGLKILVKEPSIVTFNFEYLKILLMSIYDDLSKSSGKEDFRSLIENFSNQVEEYLNCKSKILQDSLEGIELEINKIKENKPNINKCNNSGIVKQLKDSEEVIKQVHNFMVDSEESLHKKLDAALELLMKDLGDFCFEVKCCWQCHGFEEAKTRFFGTENKGVQLFKDFIKKTETLIEEANQSLEQAVEEILKDFEVNLVKEDDMFFFEESDYSEGVTDMGRTPSDTPYTPYTPYTPRTLSSLGRPVSVEPPVRLMEEETLNEKAEFMSSIGLLRNINPLDCPTMMKRTTGKATGFVRDYSTGQLHPKAEKWLEQRSTVFNSRQENSLVNEVKGNLGTLDRSVGKNVDSTKKSETDADPFFPMYDY